MTFLVSVAWRNLWRHRRRSLITAGGMAVGVALCMGMIAFMDGMFADMFRVLVEQQLGHVQIHHPDYPGKRQVYDTLDDATATVAALDALPSTVAVAPRVFGAALLGGEERSTGVLFQGILPERERALSSLSDRIIAGTWLADEAAGGIVLGEGLAKTLHTQVGDSVVAVTQATDGSMGNEIYTVVGIMQTGNTQMDRTGALLHLEDVQYLLQLHDQVHEITVLGASASNADVSLLADKATDLLPNALVQTWWEASPPTADMMTMKDASSLLVLGAAFIIAAFGVFNTMMMSVLERTRELGVLRAIGLRPGRLIAMILLESFFLAVVAVVLGLVLGGAIDLWLVVYGIDLSGSMETGLSFNGVTFDPVFHGKVNPGGVLLTAGAVFLTSIVAALLPAWRAARLEPVVALRHE